MYIQIWSIMVISLEFASVICAMLIQNSSTVIYSRHESTFWLKWCININSQSRHTSSRFDNQILLGSFWIIIIIIPFNILANLLDIFHFFIHTATLVNYLKYYFIVISLSYIYYCLNLEVTYTYN